MKTHASLELRCRSRGNPLPSLAWFKDGQPLDTASKRVRIKTKRYNDNNKFEFLPSPSSTSLPLAHPAHSSVILADVHHQRSALNLLIMFAAAAAAAADVVVIE